MMFNVKTGIDTNLHDLVLNPIGGMQGLFHDLLHVNAEDKQKVNGGGNEL